MYRSPDECVADGHASSDCQKWMEAATASIGAGYSNRAACEEVYGMNHCWLMGNDGENRWAPVLAGFMVGKAETEREHFDFGVPIYESDPCRLRASTGEIWEADSNSSVTCDQGSSSIGHSGGSGHFFYVANNRPSYLTPTGVGRRVRLSNPSSLRSLKAYSASKASVVSRLSRTSFGRIGKGFASRSSFGGS